ncbi:hypothetical protein POV27_15190 [Aureisphaera galaxeae]|uniref:hypothetical protein n=1 Tax=Aureisphaera galaxeae TaxID=1538023 RepID=UPI002350E6F9|nr:hypothetical protein [Aureisphaera galaxeae]MDC8005407.1 hypothetical protein [Aureisphaera galaxeae]
MKYLAEARYLWQNFVPKSGQADSVQGELIRAIEKLRDEAQRNGNINWDDGHEILTNFIANTLVDSNVFSEKEKQKIEDDIEALLDYEYPNTEDEIYDRMSDRIVEWYFQNKEPIPHKKNPDLRR